jgi:hypothetical protein
MRSHSYYLPVPPLPAVEDGLVALVPIEQAVLADVVPIPADADDQPLDQIEPDNDEDIEDYDEEEAVAGDEDENDDAAVYQNEYHIDNQGFVPENQRFLLGDCQFESGRGRQCFAF